MKYTIISVDDSRQAKKEWIRTAIGLKEIILDYVDARDPQKLLEAKLKWSQIDTPGPFKAGEFGIFYSVLECLGYGSQNDGILYFEDDAIPCVDFQLRLDEYMQLLPRNWDVFALWSPENQRGDYKRVCGYNGVGEPQYNGHARNNIFDLENGRVVKLWQGYGNVTMCFSEQGCKKLLQYIEQQGFFSPIDCLICIAVHSGYLQGYALDPELPVLINYDWNAETTIHTSRWGSIEELMEK